MRTKVRIVEEHHRIFRVAVWIGRTVGWALLLVAILGVVEAQLLPEMIGGFRLLPSLALGVLAVAWIAGLELFLHFFDRYLSGN